MAALTTGTEIGGYRIEGVLGRGGMGVVYEAVQLSLGRTVALKVLAADVSEDETFRARFRREGRLQAALDHAHIVPIYEAGALGDDNLFIAMRLIRGATLKELVRIRALDPARTLKIVIPIADALDTAHESQLVHRDVKPQNILVGRRDHAYLADFGLTRAPSDTAFTKTGSFVGTLDYIAPEQIRGDPAIAASDIYSLAAATFECLTGQIVFAKPNEASVLYAHMAEAPPRASAIRPELPPAVDEVFDRALSKIPSERHTTALEFAMDLEEALRPASIAAAPPDRDPVAYEASVAEPATRSPETAPAAVSQGDDGDAAHANEPDDGYADRAPVDESVGESTEIVARPALAEPPAGPKPAATGPSDGPAGAEPSDADAEPARRRSGASRPDGGDTTFEHARPGAATHADRRPGREPSAPIRPAAESRPRRLVRRRAGRRASIATLASALIALVGVAGLMLGRGGTAEPSADAQPTSAPLGTLSADALSVRFPATWAPAEAVPDIPGLELAGAAALEPSGDQASGAIVVGRSRGAGRTLLPATFLKRLPETPSPDQPVRLADAAAYRYDDLTVEGADAPVTLYVAPLTDGVATVACIDAESDCPGVAASLKLGDDLRPVGLGPRKQYAQRVGAALRRLREERASAARQLRAAGTAKAQSDAAQGLRAAYGGFARRLEKVTPTPLERTAHPALIRAARRVAAAYGSLATAARANRRAEYDRSRRAAADREAGLRRSLRALDSLGYEVG